MRFKIWCIAESFINLLKRQRIRRRDYRTSEEERDDVFDYIETFYDPNRSPSATGCFHHSSSNEA